ncbi:MAG: DUF1232 domain-containing protein [Muribaculaceae bacterium]|nr:DUF1232 domain-containing protein [Muribaculaceae bacterium]
MTGKNTYICSDCGCVFEGKNVIVNLKERLGKDSFKSILQNPFKRLFEMIDVCVCPECGSNNVVELDEKTETGLSEYMISDWDSSLLEEYFDPEATSVDSPKGKRGVREFIGKTIGFFNGKINDFKEKYNSSDLMRKIAVVAKKAGASTVYHALLLYYVLTGKDIPTSKKIIVMAALGYFIAPVDFIPDFVLMGLFDDGSVLLFALNQILPYITDEDKAKALAKLHDWFGETEIVSVISGFLPDSRNIEAEISVKAVGVENYAGPVETGMIKDTEISEVEGSLSDSDVHEKTNNQTSKSMEIIAPYKEINDYVAERFNQPISLAYENQNEIKVSYTKHVVFKDMSVNIRIGIEEVKADSVLFSYDAAFGVDSIISKAISFIAKKFPKLSAGIHPEDNHRILINLSEIEKARPVVENIELCSITPYEDGLKIKFGLLVPKQ